MSAGLKRLERLHILRCRMAEAAGVERKRIAQEQAAAAGANSVLQQSRSAVLYGGAAEPSWRERQALLQVLAGQSRGLVLRCAELAEAEAAAAVVEREAVLAREQVGRIVERVRDGVTTERSRREQRVLDDLFATARVRSAMTMNL